jgi:hypothetical protein
MISLTHITEEELRRFYFLEGKISGREKEINILNGVQQEYVASRIHDFIIWNDPPNKSKHELYIKENLLNMEIKYDIIKKEQEQELVKKKQENDKKKKIIHELFCEPNENVRKIVLQRFSISETDFYNEREIERKKERERNCAFVHQERREREFKKANEISAKFNRKYKLNNL